MTMRTFGPYEWKHRSCILWERLWLRPRIRRDSGRAGRSVLDESATVASVPLAAQPGLGGDAAEEARTCDARVIYAPETHALRTGAPLLISAIGPCFISPAAYASGSCGRLRPRELVRQTVGICAAPNLRRDGNTTNGDDHDLAY
jgi:hypothetical protein